MSIFEKMNKSKNSVQKKKQLLLLFLCTMIILMMVAIGVGVYIMTELDKVEPDGVVSLEKEDIPEKETDKESEKEPEKEEEAPEKIYPAPEYPFVVEEVEIKIPNIKQEYTLAWVSDLHMVTDIQASESIAEEFVPAILDRYENFSVTEDGKHAVELWPEVVKFLNYGQFDGIIFGGDMLDYYSPQNLEVFMEQYQILDKDVPVLYLRADHDYGAFYGGTAFSETDAYAAHKKVDGDNNKHKYLDFGEFRVVGINDSTRNMGEEQLRLMKEQFEMGTPVILATHVPYSSMIDESLKELSMEVRNKVYYWSGSSERYNPSDTHREFIEMLRAEESPVVQVLCGHLHASWDGLIREGLPEHIFAPAFTGAIGVIHIKGDEKQTVSGSNR